MIEKVEFFKKVQGLSTDMLKDVISSLFYNDEDYDEGGHPLPIDRELVDAMILVRGYFSPVNEKTCPGCSGCNADYDGE